MTSKQLFSGTMPFMLAKLALGGATVLASLVLLGILMGIGFLFGENGMAVTFFIWLALTGVVRFLIMHYLGYLVKAGHIAVIAEACKRGKLPNNQVAYGKKCVQERFATANVYFTVDKLVSGSVKQIQKSIDKAGDKLDFIPGMEAIAGLAKFFVGIFLGYIDECCLGWTFYNREKGACQSAADGVVIYAQNYKALLKNAAKTMLKTILLMLVVVLAAFVPVGLIFKLLKWSPLAAFLLACLIAWAVKFAFFDSYIMIRMMGSYMEVAPKTRVSFDLYGKLSSISSSFKELLRKGRQEEGRNSQSSGDVRGSYGGEAQRYAQPDRRVAAQGSASLTCPGCGAKIEPGKKFCGSCGARIAG